MQIDDYIDAAIERNGLKSERDLARVLGLKGSAVSNWRTRRAWPSDHTMINLAGLAAVDPGAGLLDLNLWRSESAADRNVWEQIERAYMSTLGKVAAWAALTLVAAGIGTASAAAPSVNVANTTAPSHAETSMIYYEKLWCTRFIERVKHFFTMLYSPFLICV
jgi:transcriptional regulator with XRE-family HTH domain